MSNSFALVADWFGSSEPKEKKVESNSSPILHRNSALSGGLRALAVSHFCSVLEEISSSKNFALMDPVNVLICLEGSDEPLPQFGIVSKTKCKKQIAK